MLRFLLLFIAFPTIALADVISKAGFDSKSTDDPILWLYSEVTDIAKRLPEVEVYEFQVRSEMTANFTLAARSKNKDQLRIFGEKVAKIESLNSLSSENEPPSKSHQSVKFKASFETQWRTTDKSLQQEFKAYVRSHKEIPSMKSVVTNLVKKSASETARLVSESPSGELTRVGLMIGAAKSEDVFAGLRKLAPSERPIRLYDLSLRANYGTNVFINFEIVVTGIDVKAPEAKKDPGKENGKAAESACILDGPTLQALAKMNDKEKEARGSLIPNSEGEKVIGLKVFAVGATSMYRKIGLKNGDILISVEGEALNSSEKVSLLDKKIQKKQGNVVILLQRAGQQLTIKCRGK